MLKTILFTCFIFFVLPAFSQTHQLLFKKGNKTMARYYDNSYITFQLKSGQWIQGVITHIDSDAFDLKVERIVNNMIGPPDTFHFSGFHYSISDIVSIPKKGVAFHYAGEQLQLDMGGGHQHFYWIKSGWLLRAGAHGYTGLYIANGLIDKDLHFSAASFGIAAGAFLTGWVMRRSYKLWYKLGKRYHLETII